MKKENIFDLYEEQHKDDQAPASDRVPGEVTPEDVAPAKEATPEPKQEAAPEPKKEATPEPEKQEPEKGGEDGV